MGQSSQIVYNEFATFASICVLPAARQAVLTEAGQPLTCGVMSVCWGDILLSHKWKTFFVNLHPFFLFIYFFFS